MFSKLTCLIVIRHWYPTLPTYLQELIVQMTVQNVISAERLAEYVEKRLRNKPEYGEKRLAYANKIISQTIE